MGHAIMHGVLNRDGKLREPPLLQTFKPGQLTSRFIKGERARCGRSMAMFLPSRGGLATF